MSLTAPIVRALVHIGMPLPFLPFLAITVFRLVRLVALGARTLRMALPQRADRKRS
jgi:hypothetical protein